MKIEGVDDDDSSSSSGGGGGGGGAAAKRVRRRDGGGEQVEPRSIPGMGERERATLIRHHACRGDQRRTRTVPT